MRVIVAGSRTITKQAVVDNAINTAFNEWMSKDPENWKTYIQPEIVSSGAYGVDWLGEKYAKTHHLPLKVFPANWTLHGKRAGILRNIEMGQYADALIAVWDGSSRGTKHMIDYMLSLNKLVFIYKDTHENQHSN